LDFIDEQNSIDSIKQSKHYLDNVDAEYNRITIFDVVLNGIGFRNRHKKREIYINPILGNMDVLGVGGFRCGFGVFYSKKFNNAQKVKVVPNINYGFNNRDLKGDLGL